MERDQGRMAEGAMAQSREMDKAERQNQFGFLVMTMGFFAQFAGTILGLL